MAIFLGPSACSMPKMANVCFLQRALSRVSILLHKEIKFVTNNIANNTVSAYFYNSGLTTNNLTFSQDN